MSEDIPDPAWRAPAHPSRTPLTRDAIVEAAIRVLDREGLDGLSMRRVAEDLGAGVASLYWHVRNKDMLLELVSERLIAEIDLPAPDPAHWQAQLLDLGRQLRRAFGRHRDSARITLGRVPMGPGLARFNEWLFELLAPAGIPDRVIAYFGDLASLYVGAFAFEESLGLASPTGEDQPADRIVAMFRDYLLSLPAGRFPNVHRAIDDILGGDADDRFTFGLEVILRGIATYAVGTGTAGAATAAPVTTAPATTAPATPASATPASATPASATPASATPASATGEAKRNGAAGREGHGS